jgi:hypothetical protein
MQNSTEDQNGAIILVKKIESDDEYSSDAATVVVEDTSPASPHPQSKSSPPNERYSKGYDVGTEGKRKQRRLYTEEEMLDCVYDTASIVEKEAMRLYESARYEGSRSRRVTDEDIQRLDEEIAEAKRKFEAQNKLNRIARALEDPPERIDKIARELEAEAKNTKHANLESKCYLVLSSADS